MSNELVSPDVVEWKSLEAEDAEQTGYILLPTDARQGGYISLSQTALFPTFEEANTVLADFVRRGMAIGAAKVVEAKLSHHRLLQVKQEPEVKPSLIVTP